MQLSEVSTAWRCSPAQAGVVVLVSRQRRGAEDAHIFPKPRAEEATTLGFNGPGALSSTPATARMSLGAPPYLAPPSQSGCPWGSHPP